MEACLVRGDPAPVGMIADGLVHSSVATFLFPVFASYKALKANDPSQLTAWLMYWIVIACILVVESWIGWFLCWQVNHDAFTVPRGFAKPSSGSPSTR
jgi:TB2/DP1, HVA22 family